MKYENFSFNFKGLEFEVKLLDNSATFPNSDDNTLHEEFKVIVKNGDKQISYKFYNSNMEREISELLNNKKDGVIWGYNGNFRIMAFKKYMDKEHMWGGYDDIKSFEELEKERIFNLAYSILTSFVLDMNTDTSSFKEFCSTFGYNEDSRQDERIFNAVIENKEKIESLKLTKEQKKFLNNEVERETEEFNKYLREILKDKNSVIGKNTELNFKGGN